MNKILSGNLWSRAAIVFFTTAFLITYYTNTFAKEDGRGNISINVATDNKQVSVSVRSVKVCELQFYVFDLTGGLVNEYKVKSNTQIKISNLNKGTYMYDVFHRDAKLKSGKIELK